jgi:hypothetical protein
VCSPELNNVKDVPYVVFPLSISYFLELLNTEIGYFQSIILSPTIFELFFHYILLNRSHKEKRSSYAPESGVRYDGVYRIEKCWRKIGIQVILLSFIQSAEVVPCYHMS